MKSNIKFFKNSKMLPVDKFFETVLYDKKFGYYNSKKPFGKEGDFITPKGVYKNWYSSEIPTHLPDHIDKVSVLWQANINKTVFIFG